MKKIINFLKKVFVLFGMYIVLSLISGLLIIAITVHLILVPFLYLFYIYFLKKKIINCQECDEGETAKFKEGDI